MPSFRGFFFLTGCTATGDEEPFLDETSDDAESVVQGSIGFFQNEFVWASNDDAHGPALIGDARELI